MLDATFKETVTLRRARAGSRGGNAQASAYDVVRDAAGVVLRIRCKIDRKRRKLVSTQGIETESDATLLMRVRGAVDLRTTDFVVDETGAGYRIMGMDEQPALFGSARYKRVELRATTITFPNTPADDQKADGESGE